ncbi:MAG: hypothetical protein ABJ251_12380 [Paracoccaceae bacterium]
MDAKLEPIAKKEDKIGASLICNNLQHDTAAFDLIQIFNQSIRLRDANAVKACFGA